MNSKNFILLHHKENNTPILINAKYIVGFDKVSLCIDQQNNVVRNKSHSKLPIKENVDKIYKLLPNKDSFIKIHDYPDNNVSYINKHYISNIITNDFGSELTFLSHTNFRNLICYETVERIYNMLKDFQLLKHLMVL